MWVNSVDPKASGTTETCLNHCDSTSVGSDGVSGKLDRCPHPWRYLNVTSRDYRRYILLQENISGTPTCPANAGTWRIVALHDTCTTLPPSVSTVSFQGAGVAPPGYRPSRRPPDTGTKMGRFRPAACLAARQQTKGPQPHLSGRAVYSRQCHTLPSADLHDHFGALSFAHPAPVLPSPHKLTGVGNLAHV